MRVPNLEFRHPDCPICATDSLGCDNTSFWCELCGATWDINGTDGIRDCSAAYADGRPDDMCDDCYDAATGCRA